MNITFARTKFCVDISLLQETVAEVEVAYTFSTTSIYMLGPSPLFNEVVLLDNLLLLSGLLGLLENLELLEFSWNSPPLKTLKTSNFSGILLEFFSSTLFESQIY